MSLTRLTFNLGGDIHVVTCPGLKHKAWRGGFWRTRWGRGAWPGLCARARLAASRVRGGSKAVACREARRAAWAAVRVPGRCPGRGADEGAGRGAQCTLPGCRGRGGRFSRAPQVLVDAACTPDRVPSSQWETAPPPRWPSPRPEPAPVSWFSILPLFSALIWEAACGAWCLGAQFCGSLGGGAGC